MEITYPKQKFYQVTITFTSVDEKGKEHKWNEVHLVDCKDTASVQGKVALAMHGSMDEWEITSIVGAKIAMVY